MANEIVDKADLALAAYAILTTQPLSNRLNKSVENVWNFIVFRNANELNTVVRETELSN